MPSSGEKARPAKGLSVDSLLYLWCTWWSFLHFGLCFFFFEAGGGRIRRKEKRKEKRKEECVLRVIFLLFSHFFFFIVEEEKKKKKNSLSSSSLFSVLSHLYPVFQSWSPLCTQYTPHSTKLM